MTTPFQRLGAAFVRVLGGTVAYTPAAGGAAVTIRGIVSGPAEPRDLGGAELPVEWQGWRCAARAADLSDGGRQGASLTVGAAAYRVVGVRPDGEGMVDLLLEAT